MKWFSHRVKEGQRERQEAEQALRESKQRAKEVQKKRSAESQLFSRIAEIRKRNHIKEVVQDIMEGR